MNTDITKQMEMVLYRTEDDNVTVSALIKDETIWLTQKAMAELFGIDTVSYTHLDVYKRQARCRHGWMRKIIWKCGDFMGWICLLYTSRCV